MWKFLRPSHSSPLSLSPLVLFSGARVCDPQPLSCSNKTSFYLKMLGYYRTSLRMMIPILLILFFFFVGRRRALQLQLQPHHQGGGKTDQQPNRKREILKNLSINRARTYKRAKDCKDMILVPGWDEG